MNNVAALALADAGRHPGRREGQTQPGAVADAAVVRLDPRRHDHADRHAAEHRHRRVPQRCARRIVPDVRLRARRPRLRRGRHRLRHADRLATAAEGQREERDPAKELFDLGELHRRTQGREDSKSHRQDRWPNSTNSPRRATSRSSASIRSGRRMPGLARRVEIKAGDILVVEATPGNIDYALGSMGLEYSGSGLAALKDEDLTLTEVVVPESSRLAAARRRRCGCCIATASRSSACRGRASAFATRCGNSRSSPATCCCCSAPTNDSTTSSAASSLLPLKDRGQRVIKRDKAWHRRRRSSRRPSCAPASDSSTCRSRSAACGRVRAAEHRARAQHVRLDRMARHRAARLMIPIGAALQTTGGTALIADGIVNCRGGLFTGCRADAADHRHDDAVGRHEQHGDRRHRGADRDRDRQRARA